MNATDLYYPPSSIADCADVTFRVVILYDDMVALSAARRTIHHIFTGELTEMEVQRDEFSFNEVIHPELRLETAQLAADCDLFIFAARSDSPFPHAVSEWMHSWTQLRPSHETAFVALIGHAEKSDSAEADQTPVEAPLRLFAERNGFDYFVGRFEEPSAPVTKSSWLRWAQAYTPRPEAWGLNE
jgi:hypothetical protein